MSTIRRLFVLAVLVLSVACQMDQRFSLELSSAAKEGADKSLFMTISTQPTRYRSDYQAAVSKVDNRKIDFIKVEGFYRPNPEKPIPVSFQDIVHMYLSNSQGQLLSLVYARKTRKLSTEVTWGDDQITARVEIAIAERNGDLFTNREAYGVGTIKMARSIYEDVTKNFELMQRYENFVEKEIFQKMYIEFNAKTKGLGSQLNMLGAQKSVSSRQIESTLLNRFFRNVGFNYIESEEGSEVTDLRGFLRTNTLSPQLSEATLLKIAQKSQASKSRILFVVVPSSIALYYITVVKGRTFEVHLRCYKVASGLPAGAFAYSTGTWAVEAAGQTAGHSIGTLLQVFKST